MTKLLTAAGILALAAAAVAMTDMDSDQGAALGMDDLMAAYPDLDEATFISADTNGDGGIDQAELAAAREAGLIPMDDG